MITLSQFSKGVTIPADKIDNANLTISILNEIFSAFPGQFKFNSGYRSPSQNAAAGGVPNSYHVKALAADFGAINRNYAELKSGVVEILQKYGYELIDESQTKNHFHIEPSRGFSPGVVQVANNEQNFAPVLLVIGLFLILDR